MSNQLINDLIRHGIDDRDLYDAAAGGVHEPGLRQVLRENCLALTAVVADLQGQVAASGMRPACHGTVRGWLQLRLAMWAARRGGDAAWIDSLAQSEAGYRHLFEMGLNRLPLDARALLQRQQLRLRELEADMDCLSAGMRQRSH